jgi:hypothetical protein
MIAQASEALLDVMSHAFVCFFCGFTVGTKQATAGQGVPAVEVDSLCHCPEEAWPCGHKSDVVVDQANLHTK